MISLPSPSNTTSTSTTTSTTTSSADVGNGKKSKKNTTTNNDNNNTNNNNAANNNISNRTIATVLNTVLEGSLHSHTNNTTSFSPSIAVEAGEEVLNLWSDIQRGVEKEVMKEVVVDGFVLVPLGMAVRQTKKNEKHSHIYVWDINLFS